MGRGQGGGSVVVREGGVAGFGARTWRRAKGVGTSRRQLGLAATRHLCSSE